MPGRRPAPPDRTMAPTNPPQLDRLLVINQVAAPLTVELLKDLSAAGVECRLLTGWVDAEDPAGLPFDVLHATPLTKAPAVKRIWSWGVFALRAWCTAIRHRRRPILVVTNPPWTLLGMPLVRRLFRARYVLLMYDLYPDVVVRMGMAKSGGLLERVWKRLSRRAMLRAEGVITLGEHMADTLRGHLKCGDDVAIEIIPNWADTDVIHPLPKADNPFAREHGLVEKLVVTYSGSFGATHDMESIVAAAEMLTDLPDVHFVVIGGGTRQREVAELVKRKNLPNLTLLGFQPLSMLPYALAASDCAITCLDEGYEGVSVPSKTYYALAAGAALLAVSNPGTELTDMVAEHGCGTHIPPRSPEVMAAAIRRLHGDRELLQRQKNASRDIAERLYSRRCATDRYLRYLSNCFGAPGEPRSS